VTTIIVRGVALLSAVLLGIAGEMVLDSVVAQQTTIPSDRDQKVVVWTAIIPDGFPRNVFTWRLSPDGAYEEDGRDAVTGKPIQTTLSGRWTVEGARMILRQDDIPYVFDGVVVGDHYSGTLYLRGRKVFRFCAVKGEAMPQPCEVEDHASAAGRPERGTALGLSSAHTA
jgi:hypothetical protein